MLLALSLLSACSSPDDTADNISGVEQCLADWSERQSEPALGTPETQIHVTSAFDGEKLWMAWSVPNDWDTFDIRLARMGCGGDVEVEPVTVTADPDNEVDPVLAISGDRLMVAWSAYTDTGAIEIRYRIYDLDGTSRTEVTPLQASRDGVLVTGNAILPALAAHPDGFVLAGSWGHEDAAAFQAFSVLLDADGVVQGDAIDAELDTEYGQTAVSVTLSGDTPVLAWQEDSTTSTAPAAWQAPAGSAATLLGEPGARPSVMATDAGVWSAWDSNSGEITLRSPDGVDLTLDLPGSAHSPRLAARQDGIALLSMRLVDGIYNALDLTIVTAAGEAQTTALVTERAPSVYPVDLTLIDDTHAIVFWQEGEAPAFFIQAQWLTLD